MIYAEPNETVSTGTVNPEHLVPTFVDWMATHDNAYDMSHDEHVILNKIADNVTLTVDETYTLGELCSYLFDAMEEFAPDNCYFGAIEGDGAHYGFWEMEPDDDDDDDDY